MVRLFAEDELSTLKWQKGMGGAGAAEQGTSGAGRSVITPS
jgi:hypothetical protein